MQVVADVVKCQTGMQNPHFWTIYRQIEWQKDIKMSTTRYALKRMMYEHDDINLLLTLPYRCSQSYKRTNCIGCHLFL